MTDQQTTARGDTSPDTRQWTPNWQAPGEATSEWRNVHRTREPSFHTELAPAGGVGRAFRARVENEEDLNHHGWRAEGVGPEEQPSDQPVRYEWATYFPHGYPVDDPGAGHIWQVFTQWHQQDGDDSIGNAPPIAFIVHGEELRLHLHRIDLQPGANLNVSVEVAQLFLAPVDRGTWHHFRAEIIWGLNGSIRVWHSNAPAFPPDPLQERAGIQTLFPLRRPLEQSNTVVPGTAYLKMGLYRARKPSARAFIVYHDEVRRLTSPVDR
jgi:hypothetical protein